MAVSEYFCNDQYQRVKRRRGSKVARVAVMRRLCESLWHMLSKKENYRPVGCHDDGRVAQTLASPSAGFTRPAVGV